jgi:hypothetical protein
LDLRESKWQKAEKDCNNEELYNLYASLNIITVSKSRKVIWVWHVACMEEMRRAYKILFRKFERMKPFERPKYRWEDTIRMDLRETGWEDVDWIHLAQDSDQWWFLMNMALDL